MSSSQSTLFLPKTEVALVVIRSVCIVNSHCRGENAQSHPCPGPHVDKIASRELYITILERLPDSVSSNKVLVLCDSFYKFKQAGKACHQR